MNHVPEAATVQVLLTEGGSLMYWTAERVPAYEPSSDEVGTAQLTGLPAEPDDYTLHVRTEAQAPDAWTTSEFGEQHTDCFSYLIEIGSRRTDAGRDEVGLLGTANETPCEATTEG